LRKKVGTRFQQVRLRKANASEPVTIADASRNRIFAVSVGGVGSSVVPASFSTASVLPVEQW
jgi:hypothetical protein